MLFKNDINALLIEPWFIRLNAVIRTDFVFFLFIFCSQLITKSARLHRMHIITVRMYTVSCIQRQIKEEKRSRTESTFYVCPTNVRKLAIHTSPDHHHQLSHTRNTKPFPISGNVNIVHTNATQNGHHIMQRVASHTHTHKWSQIERCANVPVPPVRIIPQANARRYRPKLRHADVLCYAIASFPTTPTPSRRALSQSNRQRRTSRWLKYTHAARCGAQHNVWAPCLRSVPMDFV